jgi:hypothetical protein
MEQHRQILMSAVLVTGKTLMTAGKPLVELQSVNLSGYAEDPFSTPIIAFLTAA